MNQGYKQNWEETRQRFAAWWKREEADRPVFVITSPKDIQKEFQEEPGESLSLREQWLNVEQVLEQTEIGFTNTAFLGEGFPNYWANLGPGSFSTFMGAKPVFEPDTVWYEPAFKGIREAYPSIDIGREWFNWSLNATQMAIKKSKGRYLITFPDFIENLDTIASLLGTEETLYYLVDAPSEIHRMQQQLLPMWFNACQTFYDLIKDEQGWSSFAAFSIWGPGKTIKLQCDISAMISSSMYDEFVLPYLKEQCDGLDSTIYHLDGKNAIHHLKSLLSITSLDCIQWTPGAGEPDGGDPCWDTIYRKTLEAGKCIHAHMPIQRVRDFVKRFGKTGILIQTYAKDEKEAEALLKDSLTW